jgi:hypothetical protein
VTEPSTTAATGASLEKSRWGPRRLPVIRSVLTPSILGAGEFHNGTRLSAYLRSDLI